ncbi:MAG: MBL fold metallo-hydrolase [Gaiellales bacterium]|jgi:glyoxylase-like metal-dependent hydrolase (beta-lactamase superfamily II)
MRVLEPASGVLAFYDGRVEGVRLHSGEPNWLDDGGFTLGIASFAIVDGDEALVYDTHLTPAHGREIRSALEERGATRLRVLLSHWHLDHVAGNEAFADCEIIAHAWTLEELTARRAAIEDATLEGPPPINPLVLPQTTFEDELELAVGRIRLTVRHMQIHSRDAAVVLLDGGDLVLAGDTLEDTVTYVSEPSELELQLAELDRMRSWGATRFLPCHGDPGRIAAGGYEPTLVDATSSYTRRLLAARDNSAAAALDLREFVRPELDAGWITYLPAYEAVHRENLAAVGAM